MCLKLNRVCSFPRNFKRAGTEVFLKDFKMYEQ